METLYVLLIDPLDRHKTHRWALHCFTDGLSIGLVILVGLDTGLNKLGSDQLHLVSIAAYQASPVMHACARLHAHQTGWQYYHQCAELLTSQLSIQLFLPLNIDCMNLETGFSQANPDYPDG